MSETRMTKGERDDLVHDPELEPEERRRDPELEYAFTHAFVQEVADQSILLQPRSELHQAVAGAIESLFPDRLDEFS